MQLYIAFWAAATLVNPILAYNADWYRGNIPSTQPSTNSVQPLWTTSTSCMNDNQAIDIVDQYRSLLEQPGSPTFNTTAEALLADAFVVYSDSINLLSNSTLGTPVFPSKTAFIAGQAQTPPIPNIVTQDIFHDCEKIAWRWIGSGIGSNQDQVSGIITMNITNGQIAAVYSEFNSGAWLINIGRISSEA